MPGMAFSSLHKNDLCYAERKTQEADETGPQSVLIERTAEDGVMDTVGENSKLAA